MYSLIRTVEPTEKLFTTQQLSDSLRISVPTAGDETSLLAYLAAATEWVEGLAGCSVMKQQWQLGLSTFPFWATEAQWEKQGRRLDYMPRPILLPRGPVIRIDSITYVANDGTVTTLDPSAYQLSPNEKPPAIYPPYSGYFPTPRYVPDSVKIKYTTGMGVDPADSSSPLPSAVRQSVQMAIRFLVAHWYENREPIPVDVTPEKLPYGLEAMLWAARIYRFDWGSYYSQ
jgi:uncharacterized phiE125 gp8 family phage protein